MKTSFTNTIWFKIAGILVAGSFLFQANVLALDYSNDPYPKDLYTPYEILPDYDWKKDAIGFAVSIGLPLVAAKLAPASHLSQNTSVATQAAGRGSIGSFLTNPSGLSGMEAVWGNMIIQHSAATIGQDLAKAGQLCWGMSPKSSQFLGMVGGSATTFGMGGITNRFSPGIARGATYGAVTGGVTLAAQEALKDKFPTATASAISGLAGTTIGAGVWGGLTAGRNSSFTDGFKNSLYGGTAQGREQFNKEMTLRLVDIGVTWTAEKAGKSAQYASILGSTGSMLAGNLSGLRQPAEITNSRSLNAVLEPAIYWGSSYTMANLTEDERSSHKVALENMGAFALTSIVSSGIHALTTSPSPRTNMTQPGSIINEAQTHKGNENINDLYQGDRANIAPDSIPETMTPGASISYSYSYTDSPRTNDNGLIDLEARTARSSDNPYFSTDGEYASAIALKAANFTRGAYNTQQVDNAFTDFSSAQTFAQNHPELMKWALNANWGEGTVNGAMGLLGVAYNNSPIDNNRVLVSNTVISNNIPNVTESRPNLAMSTPTPTPTRTMPASTKTMPSPAVQQAPRITGGNVFERDLKARMYQYAKDTSTFGAYAGQKLLTAGSSVSDYRGALQMKKLWDFSGFTGINNLVARANSVEEKGASWRSIDLVGNSFGSMCSRASNMASYHSIKNMELSSYRLIRTVDPYDIRKHSSVAKDWLKQRSAEDLAAVNRRVMLDPEIQVTDFSTTEEGKKAGLTIRLFEESIAIGKDKAPIIIQEGFTGRERPFFPGQSIAAEADIQSQTNNLTNQTGTIVGQISEPISKPAIKQYEQDFQPKPTSETYNVSPTPSNNRVGGVSMKMNIDEKSFEVLPKDSPRAEELQNLRKAVLKADRYGGVVKW